MTRTLLNPNFSQAPVSPPLTWGSLPPPHSVVGLHSPVLPRILPSQFIVNPLPPSHLIPFDTRPTSLPPTFDTKSLARFPVALATIPYHWCPFFMICRPSGPSLGSSAMSPHMSLLGSELSPVSLLHCDGVARVWNKVFLTIFTSARMSFSFFKIHYFSIYFICCAFCFLF